jgi:hypothetical protein
MVASLAEGLGGVSISSSSAAVAPPHPPPSAPHPAGDGDGDRRDAAAAWKTAPEAIKNIAALLSSNEYTNIVVLTGERQLVQ